MNLRTVFLCGLALIFLILIAYWLGNTEHPLEEPALPAPLGQESVTAASTDSGAVSISRERNPVSPPAAAAVASTVIPEKRQSSDPLEELREWIRRIDRLAKDRSFHELATPLWKELRDSGVKLARNDAAGVQKLLEDSCLEEERASNARGAVFLAAAVLLENSAFDGIFVRWTNERDRHPELARAAALAASQRSPANEQAPCASAIQTKAFRSLLRNAQCFPVTISNPLSPSHRQQILGLVQSQPASLAGEGLDLAKADRAFTEQIFLLCLAPSIVESKEVRALFVQALRAKSQADFGFLWKPAAIFAAFASERCDAALGKLARQVLEDGQDPLGAWAKRAMMAAADPGNSQARDALLQEIVLGNRDPKDALLVNDRVRAIVQAGNKVRSLSGEQRTPYLQTLAKVALDGQDDSLVRDTAIQALALCQDDEIVVYVADHLLAAESDASLRKAAASSMKLTHRGDWPRKALEICVRSFGAEKDPGVRAEIIGTMAALGGNAYESFFRKLANASNESLEVKTAAKRALGE